MNRFVKNENASLTLEAAMVMPLFLLFIVFLATIIRIGVAEIALNHAVSETTEMIAEHVYPVALLNQKITPTIDNYIKSKTNEKLNLKETKNIVSTGMKIAGIPSEDLVNSLSSKILTPIVQKKFKDSTEGAFFDHHRVKVMKAGGISKGTFEMIVEYKMDLSLPFFHQSILLKKRAYEKLWST